jgi:metallo-beta-lactamase family protein
MNTEHPWLPEDAGREFDPLGYNNIELDEETPFAVTPRGGARGVGRSCYQVDTRHGRYLVDCGLNQGGGEKFPDLRGLQPNSVDAVFLTHAHIDHCGGLPVLENQSILKDDAPILTTRGTADLAQLLLTDSLKIHKREAQARGAKQRFTEDDVDGVFERFEVIDYDSGRIESFAPVHDAETLRFRFGGAAHLLGSAWVSVERDGYRTVFSGDIGGRATHLPDVEPPPSADHLVTESTYGGLHSHRSFSDARTEVYRAITRALKDGDPVLIPTFAVGRAQTLLLLLKERLHTLPNGLDEQVQVVVDGMAQGATDLYHNHIRDTTYVSESIANRVENADDTTPFLPDGTIMPDGDSDRRDILDACASDDGRIPVIISPSGMLTGGNSPRYLAELIGRCDSARILLTGYQALGTPGRAIQNANDAGAEEAPVELETNPIGTDWPDDEAVAWSRTDDGERVTRVRVPTEWVQPVDGLSAHGSQAELTSFARDVSPETITLVHGPEHAQAELATHFAKNVESADQITRGRLLTPVAITHDPDVETSTVTDEMLSPNESETHKEQLDNLYDALSMIGEQVSDARNNALSEDQIRAIVRDEIEAATASAEGSTDGR